MQPTHTIQPTYTFRDNQLYNLIIQTMALADEYEEQHGYTRNAAEHQAAQDVLDGLKEEQALKAIGEID